MAASKSHDSFHELIDAACAVPVLLQASDALIMSTHAPNTIKDTDIFHPSLAVLEGLHAHLEKYRAEIGRPLYWTLPSRVYNPADEGYESKLFPFALHFPCLEVASQVVLWCAVVLQVLCSMLDLHSHFFPSSSSFSSPSSSSGSPGPLLNSRFPNISSINAEAKKLARNLCQSVEYCHQISNGIIGPQSTTYAQWVLKSYFGHFGHARELEWCLNIKNMTGEGFRSGVELMGFPD